MSQVIGKGIQAKIVMGEKEFIKEHKALAKMTPDKPGAVREEAKEQARELKKVLKKIK